MTELEFILTDMSDTFVNLLIWCVVMFGVGHMAGIWKYQEKKR